MNNENVAHNFVYGENGKGSNFESSVGTLYSYSSILAMKRDDYILIDDNIATYSSSSNRHALHLNRAIGWDNYNRNMVIEIYNYDTDLKCLVSNTYSDKKKMVLKEISFQLNIINDLLLKQKRARKYNYFDQIDFYLENIQRLINTFGIDKRSTIYKNFVILSTSDLKANYIDLISDYEKIKENERKKEIEKNYKRKLKTISTKTGHNMKEYSKKEINTYDFLYVNLDNDTLCTTQNICVSLTYAKLLYRLLKKGESVHGLKIDYYTIISHNKNVIKIGCHNILIRELERVIGGVV